MRKISIVSTLILFAVIVASCGTSNNVVNSHLLSKRKYTKGYFINKKANFKTDKNSEEDVAFKDESAKKDADRKDAVKSKKEADKAERIASKDKKIELTSADVAAAPVANRTVTNTDENATSPDNYNRLGSDGLALDEENSPNAPVSRSSSETEMRQMSDQERSARDLKDARGAGGGDSTVMIILLVILALILPPLAVFIYEGATTRFWIDLILFLLGYGLGFGLLHGIWWILGFISVIYALLIVLGAI